MSKAKLTYFPGILNYSILISILGVVWSDPMEVVYKGQIGKYFEPWFISIIPILMCVAGILAGTLKKLDITVANKGLILVDLVVFSNSSYLLYSKDYKIFIVINMVAIMFFVIFGSIYGMKMKDIIPKLYPEYNSEYQSRATILSNLIKFVILSIAFAINVLWVDSENYTAIIIYSLLLGVISISYEIWYMKPLRYLSLRYKRKTRKSHKKK